MLTMTCDTISRAFCLSSAGTTYQGAWRCSSLRGSLVRAHVVLPARPFRDIAGAELPVFRRVLDARQEAPRLLLLREVEEELHDARAVAVQVTLVIDDRLIAALPDAASREHLVGKPLRLQDLGMNANDQNFLVVGTVEYADSSPLRQALRCSPEKVVIESSRWDA